MNKHRSILFIFLICLSPARFSHAETIRADNLLLLDAARAGDRVVAVGERGAVLVSDDEGTSWVRAKTPVESTLTAVYFHDEKSGWAVGHDAVILRTSDRGETWEKVFSAQEKNAPLLDVFFLNAKQGYAVGAYDSFYVSEDGGGTWKAKKLFGDDMHKNAIAGGPDNRLVIAGEAGALYRSDDAGLTWKRLPSPYRGSYFGILRLPDNGLLIFGLRGKIYRSKDLGMTWSPVRAESQSSLLGGAAPGNGHVALVGHDGTALISKDNGKTFTSRKDNNSKALSSVLIRKDGGLMLFGEAGFRRLESEKTVK